jgi:hypothetical protein
MVETLKGFRNELQIKQKRERGRKKKEGKWLQLKLKKEKKQTSERSKWTEREI